MTPKAASIVTHKFKKKLEHVCLSFCLSICLSVYLSQCIFSYPDISKVPLSPFFHPLYHLICCTCLYKMTWSRGSQPFGTCVPPNQNCAPLHTPKSDLYRLRVPPNKNSTQISFISVFLTLRIPCCLFTYP
jgi:hypothetical protein